MKNFKRDCQQVYSGEKIQESILKSYFEGENKLNWSCYSLLHREKYKIYRQLGYVHN